MEVHQHTHTPREKWTHYFWEFLMLFMAVFCGFLAENQREHMVEHRREKQYMRSLSQDIKTDTANITQWSAWYDKIINSCDTVLIAFDLLQKSFPPLLGKEFFYVLNGFPDFIYTDRTMQQLKNAGGLRLIRKVEVVDSIIAYDQAVRDLLIEETVVSLGYDQLNDLTNKMLSYRKIVSVPNEMDSTGVIKAELNPWFIRNQEMFDQLYNLIFKYKASTGGVNVYLNLLKERGARLIDFVKREYHLE